MKVTAKDLFNEQERRLKKMQQQERDNAVDGNARSLFLEKPYYITQAEVKSLPGSRSNASIE